MTVLEPSEELRQLKVIKCILEYLQRLLVLKPTHGHQIQPRDLMAYVESELGESSEERIQLAFKYLKFHDVIGDVWFPRDGTDIYDVFALKQDNLKLQKSEVIQEIAFAQKRTEEKIRVSSEPIPRLSKDVLIYNGSELLNLNRASAQLLEAFEDSWQIFVDGTVVTHGRPVPSSELENALGLGSEAVKKRVQRLNLTLKQARLPFGIVSKRNNIFRLVIHLHSRQN